MKKNPEFKPNLQFTAHGDEPEIAPAEEELRVRSRLTESEQQALEAVDDNQIY